MTAPFEHASEVRDALRAIVADPALGPESLDNTRAAANLLRDLLPDAPRETGLLLAAITAGTPAMLREHITQGMAGGTAISLAAAALASQTAFTPEACQWAVTELAVALGLVPEVGPVPGAGIPAGQIAPHPATEVRADVPVLPAQESTIAPAWPMRTTAPGPLSPQPAARRPGSGRRMLAVVTTVGVVVAAAAGVIGYVAWPGTAAHHRSASRPGQAIARVTTSTPDNAWIAQLASVAMTAGTAALDSDLARVRLSVPKAQVLASDAFASLRPGYWVIYYSGPFATGTQALAYCAAHGRATRDLCIGRYLSNDLADVGYQCYPPAASPSGPCTHSPVLSPVGVVEAYVAAINSRDWARAWALGGKNLGQTYHQLIAGFADTGHVQITSISANGSSVTVLTTATETNGTIQRYRLNYLVSNGIITAGQSTLING